MSEELKELQRTCWKLPSDRERQRKLLEYFELQRHRALQLLALLSFSEKEAPLIESSITKVTKPLEVRWRRNSAAWNPMYANPGMQAYSVSQAVGIFHSACAPKFDIPGAVDLVVNHSTKGFELLQRRMEEEGVQEKFMSRKRQRVLSSLLSHSLSLPQPTQKTSFDRDSGDVVCQAEAYEFKLSLDEANQWYPTCILLRVQSRDKEEEAEALVLPSRFGEVVARQLEAYLKPKEPKDLFLHVHKFAQTLCLSLALQVWERQAARMLAKGHFFISSVSQTPQGGLTLSLMQNEYELRLEQDAQSDELVCTLQPSGGRAQVLSLAVSLTQLSLKDVLDACIVEASKARMQLLRTQLLAIDTRHDSSQVRLIKSTGELELDLLGDQSTFRLQLRLNAFSFSSTSKARRVGRYSLEEYFAQTALTLSKANSLDQAKVLLHSWNELEAWDGLSVFPSITSSLPSYQPPCIELVQRTSSPHCLYYDLFSHEGVKYVLVVEFKPAASFFHLKFVSQGDRVGRCIRCSICSVGKVGGRLQVVDQTSYVPGESLDAVVLEMRKKWVIGQFTSLLRLEVAETSPLRFQGSEDALVKDFEPIQVVISSDSLAVTCKGLEFDVQGNQDVVDTLQRAMKNTRLLQTLATRASLVGKVVKQTSTSILFKLPEDFVKFTVDSNEPLHLVCGPNNPLELLLARWVEEEGLANSAVIPMVLGTLRDSLQVLRACRNYAKQADRVFRASATSVVNVHFVFEHATEERQTFDCRFVGAGVISVWGRSGWRDCAMMRDTQITKPDSTEALPALLRVLESLR